MGSRCVAPASGRDDLILWTAAPAAGPGSVLAQYNPGMALAEAGEPGQAEARFPAGPRIPHLKGWIAGLEGEHRETLQYDEHAIARGPALEPNSPDQHGFLAQPLAVEGRRTDAGHACEAAPALDPWFVPTRRALALMAEQEGRIAAGIDHWQRIGSFPGIQRGEAEAHIRRLEAGGRRPTLRP